MTKEFVEVAGSKQLKEGRGKAVYLNGNKIALFRSNGKVYALRDFCPHRGAPLSDGYVENGCSVCVYHEWKFHLEDGTFDHNEQVKIPTYEVKEENGKIYIGFSPEEQKQKSI